MNYMDVSPAPQLMQEVDPQHEQLPHELEPLVAAVSPNKDASDTSMISISSTSLNNFSLILHTSEFNMVYCL